MEDNSNSESMSVPTVTWETLQKSLAHPNVLIRQKAVELTGRFRDVRAVGVLHSLVRDETPAIRSAAAQALVEIATLQEPQIEAALAQLITSAADDELRIFLISNVSVPGSDILLRAVIACLVDAAANIRQAAEGALKQEGLAWMLTDAAAEMLPTIEGAQSAFNAEVSAAAVRWTAQLQRAQLRRTMLNSGLAGILTLTGALQSPNALMRGAAAEALRSCRDARAVPALRDALRDPDEEVRHTVAVTLGELAWRPNTEAELASWLVAIGRWQSAAALGEVAVDALLVVARHSSPETQAAVLDVLAGLKSSAAVFSLVPLLESPHKIVRSAVARALHKLDWTPANEQQGVRFAIELEDWTMMPSFGAAGLGQLMHELKASRGHPEREGALFCAMNAIGDVSAVPQLVAYCSDGEVAGASLKLLQNWLEQRASEISGDDLQAILALKSVVQFRFSPDASGRWVRSGMELADVKPLRAMAAAELGRRDGVLLRERAQPA